MDERLTTNEVAVALKRHPVTIRRALEAGELHGTQRGARGQWRILAACAEAYADGRPCAHRANNVVPLRRPLGGVA